MRDLAQIKVAVAGTGYVGLSISCLLAQHHHVEAVDVVEEKVTKINQLSKNSGCWLSGYLLSEKMTEVRYELNG